MTLLLPCNRSQGDNVTNRLYAQANRRGSRDIFCFDGIRRPVVAALVDVGMSANLIIDLVDVTDEDVIAVMHGQAPHTSSIDIKRALAAWSTCHAYTIEHMSKTYASAAYMQSLNDFMNRKPQHAHLHDTYVAHRINHEIHQALSIWLRIDTFVEYAQMRARTFDSLLDPCCPNSDRALTYILYEAFAEQLGLPRTSMLELWKDAVDLALKRQLPRLATPGECLTTYLLQCHWELMQRRARPFLAPIWPQGSGDRVRAVLRSRTWQGDEAHEVDYACDSARIHEESDIALEVYKRAKAAGDAEAFAAAKADLEDKQRATSKLHKISDDRHVRVAARKRVAAWLCQAAPELIELVRPCGNPLNATI
ncbi:MAG: hypothetical protein UY72_C0026G0005 [Candidatus Uhrbacteria bacterium GW2011_GWD2_52_7]|uniref:Uncharacterized protein n=1 Tax=Candidatus Uhrbacteria bacterium GW2011_GWD2_52_7 TaxID=1618989 RepID=A0A0G1XFF7_9BACT|nr:MAG: hypothetical protein UY72_C0026G0005 [Candidatus Uhrbacteria bacterium GW2011_GWD2_52_7]